jgi:hypothetical protein
MGPINPLSPSGSGSNSILNRLGAININNRNEKSGGGSFSLEDKIKVWNKTATIPGQDASLWRKDVCGAYLYWNDYGNTKSKWGWEIDHILPVIRGGSDMIGNLQALHWKNNRSKGDSLGKNYCVVTFK